MTLFKTTYGRRSFLKSSALAGGGMMLGFSWLASCKPAITKVIEMPKEWFKINGYLKIGENGIVTIMSPNPEIGQNVKTSMPMIIAEELDVDWKKVIVEQAPLDTSLFQRQLAGGSQSIRNGWEPLRMAGATAKQMLKEAAAKLWSLPVDELTTDLGVISHEKSGKTIQYGEVASAAALLEIPKVAKLKDQKDFKIIGTSKINVDGQKIVTGKPLFGLDYTREGMLIAMIVHPPAFGLQLKSYDDTAAKKLPGIKDVFKIKVYNDGETQWCDTTSFNELVVVVGTSTWEVLNAKKAISCEWTPIAGSEKEIPFFGSTMKVDTPSGLESTEIHKEKMKTSPAKLAKVVRKDGDVDAAFKRAAQVLERTYSAPFLAHNTMEPMNFFADVKANGAELIGPIQTPEFMEKSVATRLGLKVEDVEIQMSRMGGGFGRRLYGHFLVEAAVISQKTGTPIKLIYTREDDMSVGIYRPAYQATYRAAIDENKNVIAFHVVAGGIPESPLTADRFPAGAIDHYLAEEWESPSNISVGAFRAPRSNFIAGAEQSFLDELAETVGKDPIDFRLELLEKAQKNPVGKNNDYDAVRYAGVLKLVKEKSKWTEHNQGVHRGVSAYYCHNSYVAQVLELEMTEGKPVINKVTAAIDCGIVVNTIAATNLTEGGMVDGIGHSLYSSMTFKDGIPQHNNFNTYQVIRHSQAPQKIDVHFVESKEAPTGLGEPPFPPIIGAVANALYQATGKRYYHQPFLYEDQIKG